jgi:DNA polymerase-3 subunit delta'
VPIVDLYGHEQLRKRLSENILAGTLPASILLQGPRGVGKQRLALWLAEALLCTDDAGTAVAASNGVDRPGCGRCASCRYMAELTHPDLHWIFPRPRLKDSDPDLEEVRDDYAEAIADRAAANGLYAAPSGNEGIYVATVRSIVQQAAITPAIAKRKVFIVGDAERMVPQEGADMAANAFLKLLEEPPADTTIILTSSEPGALLPTIKSRVVSVRVPLVADKAVKAFVENPNVKKALDSLAKASASERVRAAGGAPGRLLSGATEAKATINARRIVDAAIGARPAQAHAAALAQGSMGARGGFSDTLDALVELLGERVRDALHRKDSSSAASAARAVDSVLQAQTHASGNVSPQLLTSKLIRDLARTLR